MANNFVLEYLDLICSTRYSITHNFFKDILSFDQDDLLSSSSSSAGFTLQESLSSIEMFRVNSLSSVVAASTNVLPIHNLLLRIQDKLQYEIPVVHHENEIPIQTEINEEKLNEAATFLSPLILHYWQLARLSDLLRCNNNILKLLAEKKKNNAQINQITLKASNNGGLNETTQIKIDTIIAKNNTIDLQLAGEKNNSATKENLQASLVLVTLLNIVFRQGMSTGILSDRMLLEAQQLEYRTLLSEYYDINFGEEFNELFTIHESVSNNETVQMTMAAQGLHPRWNTSRLGVQRTRRLGVFLESAWNNPTYTWAFTMVDPYVRRALAYVNWMFFLPRLSANFSVLSHHFVNDSQLTPIEAALPRFDRLRAHWMRFWWEVFNDIYWFFNGIMIAFVTGGAVSPAGIALSITMQTLDLFFAIVRACVELYRYYRLQYDLHHLSAELPIEHQLDARIRFEQMVFSYQIFHFWILMMSLCVTLPMVAAVSTIWPVVGGVSAVMMTIFTHYISKYFEATRQAEYEPRPKALQDTFNRGASQPVNA